MKIKKLLISNISTVILILTLLSMPVSAKEIADYLADVPFDMPELAAPVFPENSVNITDFGAVGDGHTMNTEAIQKAIEACVSAGGGQVIIPEGIWYTEPIQLRSNIDLHLECGALLQFPGYSDSYPLVEIVWDGVGRYRCRAPIFGYRLENVAITGEGIIDGAGDLWRPVKKNKMTERQWQNLLASGGAVDNREDIWWPSEKAMNGVDYLRKLESSGKNVTKEAYRGAAEYLRPVMINLVECKNVLLDGPTFQNSPGWNIHPLMCENLIIRNINVRNPWYSQNGDGMDLESCKNALVYNCRFDVGDDAMCLKSGRDEAGRKRGIPTENVVIEDCVVYHGHGGFTVGSEMSGGIRNISVRHCSFIGTDVGLRFKSTRGRGGVVENIYISNILMKEIPAEAIRFNMYYNGSAPIPEDGEENVLLNVPVPPVTEETPRFHKIFIDNIVCRGALNAVFLQGLPEMPIQKIELSNIYMTAKNGLTCIDAQAVKMNNIRILPDEGPIFHLHNSQDIMIEKVTVPEEMEPAVYLTGSKTSEIHINEDDFINLKNKIKCGQDVVPDPSWQDMK